MNRFYKAIFCCQSDATKEESKSEFHPFQSEQPAIIRIRERSHRKEWKLGNISENQKYLQKFIFSRHNLLLLILCFLLPQEAVKCGLFLASPNFFHDELKTEKRKIFINQNKKSIENLVQQMNTETPIITDLAYKNLRELLSVGWFRTRNEILIDLQDLGNHFEWLSFQIIFPSQSAYNLWIYFIYEGNRNFLDLDYFKHFWISFKHAKILFQTQYSTHRREYQFGNVKLGLSVNSSCNFRLKVVGFEANKIKIMALD